MDSTTKRTVVVLGCLCAFTLTAHSQEPGTIPHDMIMEKKLESAQDLFAAVTTGDFAEVNRQAQKLSLLSHEGGWNRLQTPEYSRLSHDFRATTKQLQVAAGDENLDAVALGFVKLSVTCIDCHRHTGKELKGSRFTEVSFQRSGDAD